MTRARVARDFCWKTIRTTLTALKLSLGPIGQDEGFRASAPGLLRSLSEPSQTIKNQFLPPPMTPRLSVRHPAQVPSIGHRTSYDPPAPSLHRSQCRNQTFPLPLPHGLFSNSTITSQPSLPVAPKGAQREHPSPLMIHCPPPSRRHSQPSQADHSLPSQMLEHPTSPPVLSSIRMGCLPLPLHHKKSNSPCDPAFPLPLGFYPSLNHP